MNAPTTTIVPSKALLSGWERVLLLIPTLGGLFFGIFPLFLPKWFADLIQFPAVNPYVYQLAGAATLGYGVPLLISLFQKEWLPLRLPLIGVLVFNLGSIYACVASIYDHQTAYSVFVVLAASVLIIVLTSLLLAYHRGVPRSVVYRPTGLLRIFVIVGGLSAAVFGLVPLFLPAPFFPLFHFQTSITGIARQAGAACLGYAVLSALVQLGLDARELPLITVMAAAFNGASGIMSIPYLLTGQIFLLPWIIVPVGLSAFVASVLLLRYALLHNQQAPAGIASEANALT